MLSKIGKALIQHRLVAKVANIRTGIEVERDRTLTNGQLSNYPYPKEIGLQQKNPWITNDFLETMSEVVTPSATNDLDTLHYSYAITLVLRKALADGELLWPMSMPPILPTGHDESLLAKGSAEKRAYIKGLYHRYGLAKQTPCGVHINVSLDDNILDFIEHHFNEQFKNSAAVKNFIYPIIAQGFIKYRWLLTYLFGASPVAQANYFVKDEGPKHPIRSIRQSHYGYPTSFEVDYSSVTKYANKIMEAVKTGRIMSIAEFYGAVRFKGNKDLTLLSQEGIRYLELRMFDLDPTSEVSVKLSTLRFVRILMMYFLMNEPKKENVFHEANLKNERVSMENPDQRCQYHDEAVQFLKSLRRFVNELELGPEYLETLNQVDAMIADPRMTINAYLKSQIKDGSLLEYGLKQAQLYQNDGLQSQYYFEGFKDNDGNLSANELISGLFDGNWIISN